jgi:hypothetical protein
MKQTMRNTLSLLFLVTAFIQLQAQVQKPLAINGDMLHGIITINGVDINAKSTRAECVKALSTHPRVVKQANRDKLLFYDDQGLSFALKTGTDTIQVVRLNYESQDSFRFAEGPYKGTLSLNGKSINNKTTPEEIAKATGAQLVTMPGASSFLCQGDGLIIMMKYASSGLSEMGLQFNVAK